MHADHWRRVEELYHAAYERPVHERGAFLDEVCAGDARLRAGGRVAVGAAGVGRRVSRACGTRSRTPAHAEAGSPQERGSDRTRSSARLGPAAWARCIARGTASCTATSHSKSFREFSALDPDRLARFRREAQVLAVAQPSQHRRHLRLRRRRRYACVGAGAGRRADAGGSHRAGTHPAALMRSRSRDRCARRSPPRTSTGSFIATSSQPTSNCVRTARSRCSTSGWPRSLSAMASEAGSVALTHRHAGRDAGRGDPRDSRLYEPGAGARSDGRQAHRHLGVRLRAL